MDVVAYYRVSTQRQADSGLGLEAQKSSVEEFCRANGWNIVDSFVEGGVSGKSDIQDRPALVDALASIKKNSCSGLVVAKLDRLSRDLFVQLTIERVLDRLEARVISSSGEGTDTDSPHSKLVKNILAAVAENEAAMISMRTKAALKAAKERGTHVGRPPQGFIKNEEGRWIPGPDFWMVARIVFLRRKKLPLRMIVSIMNQDDVREKTGRTYSLRTVQNICQRWSKGTRSWFAGIKDVSMIVPNIENPPWMREGVMPCI
jgi:DNA invertase Pin-like site-specific DNA recombinase